MGTPHRIVPHAPKWHGEIAAFGIATVLRVLAPTWRMRVEDNSGHFGKGGGEPAIFAIWHNRLAVAMNIWRQHVRGRGKATGLAALVSASKDGAILARTLEYFGVQGVRGSSSRRGAQSFLELTSALEKGKHVAITPDGPRGPKYTLHDGIIRLAQISGCRIIPVGVKCHSKYCLKSWDEFQVPLPFSRCDVHLGAGITIPPEATDEEFAQQRGRVLEIMRALNID